MNYVCLDVGNVLVHVDFQIFIRDLSKQLNITLEEAEYFMNRTHALHDMGLTKMADELRDHFKIKSPLIMEDLLKSWDSVITPNYQMIIKMLSMMDRDDLKVALVSNVGLEHAGRMARILNHHGFFDRCVHHLSCYVGARKPTKLYYQSFLSQYPEFYGAAYLDDLQENLDASVPFGFRPMGFSLQEHKPLDIYLDSIEKFILQGNSEENSRRH